MDRHVVRYGSRVDGALSARPKQRAFMGGRRIQSQCKARAEVQAGYHNCPDCGGCAAAVSIHRAFGNTTRRHVRFSNRPSGVKHFQTAHHCNVDVTHGLALLFGIGTKALPSWDPRTRRNNLLGGLAVRRTAGPRRHANSPHSSSREGHLSTAGWSSSFLLSDMILHGCHAAAATCSRVRRNSVPSTHIRCMITASRRASATIAFFIPRRLAICIAQALSQDHFLERIML